MSYPKQIIVVRTDLKMSSGKTAAQVAHSSLGVFANWMKENIKDYPILGDIFLREYTFATANNTPVFEWLENSFTKVVLGVDSIEELLELDKKVRDAGLLSCLITDNGLTEFGGVPTITCLCIGPLYSEDFVGLTDHLKPLKDDSSEQLRSIQKLVKQLKDDVLRLTKKGVDVSSTLEIINRYETKKNFDFSSLKAK